MRGAARGTAVSAAMRPALPCTALRVTSRRMDARGLRFVICMACLALASCGDERTADGDEPSDGSPGERDDDDVAQDEGAAEGDDSAARDAGEPARDGALRELDAGGPARDAASATRDARANDSEDAMPRSPTGDAAAVPARDGGKDGAAADAAASAGPDAGRGASDAGAAPLSPTFHIALRVHRADSGLTGAQLAAALEEMNEIWWKQAGVCFEVEVVRNEELRRDGFDMWFHRSRLGCNATGNGVYCGDHDVHTLDAPMLNRADNAAWDTRLNPARTSAHELGHGLNLDHYNGFPDSNDSLMSSGRQGFKLHEMEVATARQRAQSKAVRGAESGPCPPVPVVD